MNMYELISKKKAGGALSNEQIAYFVRGFTEGTIPDYQAAALLMAICWQKMNYDETVSLTSEMMHSGDVLDLSKIDGLKVDKHSTGGVGDKTTLIITPMAAALGLKIPKMSGRGLGHTGGTIDKLESIPGFSTALSETRFVEIVNTLGMAIASQTAQIAPADKKIYALRDVTATVDNISLIASSIMSKKLACGADVIVLDVKCGSGSFAGSVENAFALAEEMVNIGKGMRKKVSAVITDMNQPLGLYVGNSLEVIEAIDTLKGCAKSSDLLEDALSLGTEMLIACGVTDNDAEARQMLISTIDNGSALQKFRDFVAAQGGNPDVTEDYSLLPIGKITREVKAPRAGYIYEMDCEAVGMASLLAGAGRAVKDAPIDFGAGMVFEKKLGAKVAEGDVLAVIYSSSEEKAQSAAELLLSAITISDEKPEAHPMIYGKVR